MNWLPYVAFLVSAFVAVVAQRAYFDDLVRLNRALSSDDAVAVNIRRRPTRLPGIVASETTVRLRALVTRQPEPDTERRRIVADIAVVLSLVTFAWLVLQGV